MYSLAECNHTILVGTFGAFWAAKRSEIGSKGSDQYDKVIFCPTENDLEPFRPLWAQKLDKLALNWPKLGQIQQVKKIPLPEALTYLSII